MDANSTLLIRFLSLSIRALIPDHELYQEIQIKIMDNSIDWDTIYQEAFAHQVHGLLYPVISALPKDCCDFKILSRWQRGAVLAGLHQLEHMKQMEKVLFGFHKENIPVVKRTGLKKLLSKAGIKNYGGCRLVGTQRRCRKVKSPFAVPWL